MMLMSPDHPAVGRRLVDYVVITGYMHRRKGKDQQPEGGFQCQGKVLQRFPQTDWEDTPFTEGLEHFCQPNGWVLSTEKTEPKFFIAGLTDLNGSRQYCAVLSFCEAVAKQELEGDSGPVADDEVEEDPTTESFISLRNVSSSKHNKGSTSLPRHIVPGVSLPALANDALLFAPKCLVLVSKHDYPEVFRHCLGTLYTAYSECLVSSGGERIKLETLIGNLLGSVYVPVSNGPQVRFSLGANDRLTLQPAGYESVPCTGNKVAQLFKLLGIRNTLTVMCAVLTECKILLYSQSFMRLNEACTALVALMYPLTYSHVFIPILPSSLLEVLSTPTPFIIGVNSIHETGVADLLDVVKIDLDGGAISIPENMTVPQPPAHMMAKVQQELTQVLQPGLAVTDNAFRNTENSGAKKPLNLLDKELRAVMLRFIVHLLDGYRSCLTVVRIHSNPFITFHKAAFMGARDFCDSFFMKKLLNSMFMSAFVGDRGIPWRLCDIFDNLCSEFTDQLRLEQQDASKVVLHVKMLAEEFYRNENLMSNTYDQKIPQPADGAMTRIHQPIFPTLDPDLVDQFIMMGVEKRRSEGFPTKSNSLTLVPHGTNIKQVTVKNMLPHNARKLEVLRKCITSIFENKISDAKKTFPAVLTAILKSKLACLALCEELTSQKGGKTQVLLEHQQFDMIVRLMNAALQDDSDGDEHGIALAMLPLSITYGRKLSQGVTQFAYTLIQGHAVWQNQQFWEASFFQDVQKGIKELYLAMQDFNSNNNPLTNDSKLQSPRYPEKSALELAAEELKIWHTLDSADQKGRIKAEERTVFSKTLEYVNYMVYMMCSLDLATPKKAGKRFGDDFENVSNSISNSMADSDSIDAESGFEDQEISDGGAQIVKTVQRFADKVCSESNVAEEDISSIRCMVPSTVAMHLEQLEAVSTQASRLPLIQKSKITDPVLLPGEELVHPKGLRVYLLSDGRSDLNGNEKAFLPAEGAIFLTTYRIIFKGVPLDPFEAEHTITRFFPVSSLTRDKRFNLNEYLNQIEQQLKEGIQLRSNTFQLIRAAFDNEVTTEEVDNFRRAIQRVQYPENLFQLFAFTSGHPFIQEAKTKAKNAKYMTIKGIASKTLKNVSKVTGYQPKKRKTSKYLLPNMMPTSGRLSVVEITNHEMGIGKIQEEDESLDTAGGDIHMPKPQTLSRSLERLVHRSYFKDWIRLGLISPDYALTNKSHHQNDNFRVTSINHCYAITQSYPALLLVPVGLTDAYLKAFARLHKQSRFSSITWRHPENHALLLRGAGFHNRGMMGMIRRHQDAGTAGPNDLIHVETDAFTEAVLRMTPRAVRNRDLSWNKSGSELSINSLVYPYVPSSTTSGGSSDYPPIHNYPTLTPNMARKMNPLTKAMDTLTRTTAAPTKFSRISLSSMKGNKTLGSQSSLATTTSGFRGSYRYSDTESQGDGGIHNFLQNTALYVFGDKNQVKGIKSQSKIEFIPVDYPEPRRIRASFKKLMRACVPSNVNTQPDQTYLKQVEGSEWLSLLQMVMQLSGAVVDLLDIQAASVSLCLEEGWDVTAQISSIAMLCLDPYYRTIEGFRVLIEKEWIFLGHRFNHRSNLSQVNQDAGFTPIFLQFLDIVHQILNQFPLAFEFNHFFLKLIAYHHISCRFHTFLLDNEMQRHQLGFLTTNDKCGSIGKTLGRNNHQDPHSSDEEYGLPSSSSPTHSSGGANLFDYIDYHASRGTVFQNFSYAPDLSDDVIRPYSHISDLKIWDYYTSEELRYGATYDLELLPMNVQAEEKIEASDSLVSTADTKDSFIVGYDCLERSNMSSFSEHLQEIAQIESYLGGQGRHWSSHWKATDVPPLIPPRDKYVVPVAQTTPSLTAKQHGRIMHKRSTMELILKGKIGTSATSSDGAGGKGTSFAHSHNFEKYNYSTPTSCDVCNSLLWGPVKTGLKCSDCGFNCHDKCRDNVSKTCSKYRMVQRDTTSENMDQIVKSGAEAPIFDHDNDDIFGRFQPVADESSQIICQGYLYKQANFKIKGWKQRWFVLDATKHQLRYYDTREDFHCKGFIDLSEVTKILSGSVPPAGAPKKSDDGCYFDMMTLKRTYCFCAESSHAANEWIQKIQSCLS